MVHYNSLAQLGKLCDEVLKFEAESHQAQQESQVTMIKNTIKTLID